MRSLSRSQEYALCCGDEMSLSAAPPSKEFDSKKLSNENGVGVKVGLGVGKRCSEIGIGMTDDGLSTGVSVVTP